MKNNDDFYGVSNYTTGRNKFFSVPTDSPENEIFVSADGGKNFAIIDTDEEYANSIGSFLTAGLYQSPADKERMALRRIKVESKAEARTDRSSAKEKESQAKIQATKSAERTGIASAKASEKIAQANASRPIGEMSMGMKIGIGVGALILIGGGAWFMMRKKK